MEKLRTDGIINLVLIKQCDSVAKIRKDKGDQIIIASIAYLLNIFMEQSQAIHKMPPEQVAPLADKLSREYYFFTLEDFALFFNDASLGKYGTNFNKLDAEIIGNMIAKYDVERTKLNDNLNTKLKKQDFHPMDKEARAEWYEAAMKIGSKVREVQDKPPTVRSKEFIEYAENYNKKAAKEKEKNKL